MIVRIKNADTVDHTWVGQTIEPNEYYTIQDTQLVSWQTNDELLTAIATGTAVVNNGTIDISGVSNQLNYLKGNAPVNANGTPVVDLTGPKDNDGATIHRAKAAKAGWTYHMTAPEFTTSLLGSLYHKDISLNNLNEASIKFYDANNTELTTQESCDTDCVKTVFVFEPTWDYEIIGGTIKTANDVADDVRVWVVAVPDVPANMGGSKIMVQNVNLKYVDPNNGIEADGRASKYMAYNATYHTNKLQLIVRHPAGHKLAMMMAFEVYRA